MRYTRIGPATWAIAGFLVLAALLFAWIRSGDRGAPRDDAPGAPFEWRAAGSEVYAAECRSCHRQGERAGRVAPLRGLAVDLFTAEGGRDYLVHFLLTGQVRRVAGGTVTFEDDHPPYDHLDDREAAAVLNHMLTAFGNEPLLPDGARLYDPSDIPRHRR